MRRMAELSPTKRRGLYLVAIFALYLAIACLITWPLIVNLGSLLVGRTSDAMVHYWNGWWFQQALQIGQSPFQTDLLNFPDGVSLVTHNFALLNIMPWLLLEPIIGGITAYNLIILLSLALCGWGMYLLADELLEQRHAAFIAGLIYMAWPFRLSQLDHPNLVATFWIPIFFLFLIRVLRDSHWLDGLWAGVALALVGYTRWQLLIPVSMMTLIFMLGTAKSWISHWRETVPRLVLAGVIGFVALLPPAVMLVGEQLNSDISADVIYEEDERNMSTDLLAYLTPSKRHFILNATMKPLVDSYYKERTPGRRYPTYIGLSVLILAAIGLIKRWRETWFWLLMALVLIGLAAGMAWRVNGQTITAVPTLYKLLAPLQAARLMRVPERYVMFLALPAAVLAAYGWRSVISLRQLSRWRLPLTVLLGLVILFEYQSSPLQSQYTEYDKQVFEQLAQEPGEFAILNIPLRYRFSKEYQFEQTIHKQPILQGHVSREPENLYRLIEESEWLDGMPDLEVDPGFLMAQLNEAGVGYVVLSQHLLEDPTWRLWKRHVPYAPYHKDDRYLVYATAPQIGRELDQPQEMMPGLGTTERSLTAYCGEKETTAVAAITWVTTETLPENVGLQLLAASEETGAEQSGAVVPLVDGWPSSQWPVGTVTRQAYEIDLPAEYDPFKITLQMIDLQQQTPVGEPTPMGRVDAESCTIDGAGTEPANLFFGDGLRLLSYGAAQESGELVINLHWLAEERPGAAYKFFIRITDPQTNEVVAQIDTMPLNWSFPTTDWKAGELVADEIRVPLAGVAPGDYELAMGVYLEESGERLPVTGAGGGLRVDDIGRLVLPVIVPVNEE